MCWSRCADLAQHAHTKAIKAALAAAPDTWVRGWRDGTAWVGSTRTYDEDRAGTAARITDALVAAGYRCRDITVPGSSFNTCIEVLSA